MTPSSPVDLREEWRDLLRRRSALVASLSVYDGVVTSWAEATTAVAPLRWSAPECAARWERSMPLLAEAPIALPSEAVEPPLVAAMEVLGATRAEDAAALQRFAEAWDRGEIGPAVLMPSLASPGPPVDLPLGADAMAFLACAALRPTLEAFFAGCRAHLVDGAWELGQCPFCGAPPGFADVVEDGRRRLACHVCGGGWIFPRLRCPFCRNDRTRDLARLEPGPQEEGYAISVCKECRAYVKELDRRVRWNGGPALVEDWGSPHFDLLAHREGYWRPLTPALQLARRD
jgi:hypothetical protein